MTKYSWGMFETYIYRIYHISIYLHWRSNFHSMLYQLTARNSLYLYIFRWNVAFNTPEHMGRFVPVSYTFGLLFLYIWLKIHAQFSCILIIFVRISIFHCDCGDRRVVLHLCIVRNLLGVVCVVFVMVFGYLFRMHQSALIFALIPIQLGNFLC